MWVDFMGTALDGHPVAQLEPPPGMVQVRVDPNTGNETNAKSGILEMVNEEFSKALLGPEPVRIAGPTKKADTSVRRSAPRVMDDLF
jgi:penicillin-binding protein 1A